MELITSGLEIKRHNSAVVVGIQLSGVKSFIDDAINKNILPKIGRETFTEIVNARESLTAIQKPLFDLLQKACVGFMMAYYSTSGAIQINDGGISVLKGSNFLPASDKKLMALRKDSFEKGYESLELALEYLEAYINDFTTYKNSSERKENRSLLINTSYEFQNSGVNIGNSSQLYQILRTYQVDAERTYINPLLGDELNDLIRGLIIEGGATPIQMQLINEIRRPLANFTMLEAIPYMAVSIDATGIYKLSESVGGMAANVETKASADVSSLQAAMFRLQAKADNQIEQLRKWIAKHKSEFIQYIVPTTVDFNDDPNSNIYIL